MSTNERVIQEYRKGLSQDTVGRMFGLSKREVGDILTACGIKKRPGGPIPGKRRTKRKPPKDMRCACGNLAEDYYQGRYVCRDCLCPDGPKLQVEAFIIGRCALADGDADGYHSHRGSK